MDAVKAEGTWDGGVRLSCADTSTEVAIVIEGLLEAVGFDVDVEIVPGNGLVAQVINDHDYDIACWSLSLQDYQAAGRWSSPSASWATATPA